MKKVTDKLFEDSLVEDKLGQVGTSKENKIAAMAAALVTCIHECGERTEERVFYSSMFNSLLAVSNRKNTFFTVSEETHQACEQDLVLKKSRKTRKLESTSLDVDDLQQKCVLEVISKAREVLTTNISLSAQKDQVEPMPAHKVVQRENKSRER